MHQRMKSVAALALSAGLTLSSLAGCAGAGDNAQDPNNPNRTGQNRTGQTMVTPAPQRLIGQTPMGSPGPMMSPGPRTAPDPLTGSGINGNVQDGMRRANTLRQQMGNMNGINVSDVLIQGNRALVGYNITDPTVNTLRAQTMISDRLRQLDRTVRDITTTNSPQIIARMRQLSKNMTGTKPMQNIGNEFNRLIQSINPMKNR